MWAVNKKTGVRHEMTEDYYDKYYHKNPDMEKLAGEPIPEKPVKKSVKKTLKTLKIEAKEMGITGSDRMNKEEIEALLEEE